MEWSRDLVRRVNLACFENADAGSNRIHPRSDELPQIDDVGDEEMAEAAGVMDRDGCSKIDLEGKTVVWPASGFSFLLRMEAVVMTC